MFLVQITKQYRVTFSPLLPCVHTCMHMQVFSPFLFSCRGEWDLKPHLPFPNHVLMWDKELREGKSYPSSCNHSLGYRSAGQAGWGEIRALSHFCDILMDQQVGNALSQLSALYFPWTCVQKNRDNSFFLPEKSDLYPVQRLGFSADRGAGKATKLCCISSSHSKEARQDLLCETQLRETSS